MKEKRIKEREMIKERWRKWDKEGDKEENWRKKRGGEREIKKMIWKKEKRW